MKVFLVLTALLAAPLVAHAQYKIEELVAKGAQVMSAEQLRAAFVGKNLAGLTEQGWDVEYRLIPGGKLEGMMHTQRGSSGIIGTWSINEKNQICGDITSVRWGIRSQRCSWYWRVGDEYYVTNSRAEMKRQRSLWTACCRARCARADSSL